MGSLVASCMYSSITTEKLGLAGAIYLTVELKKSKQEACPKICAISTKFIFYSLIKSKLGLF